jgi:hypothetical protein
LLESPVLIQFGFGWAMALGTHEGLVNILNHVSMNMKNKLANFPCLPYVYIYACMLCIYIYILRYDIYIYNPFMCIERGGDGEQPAVSNSPKTTGDET